MPTQDLKVSCSALLNVPVSLTVRVTDGEAESAEIIAASAHAPSVTPQALEDAMGALELEGLNKAVADALLRDRAEQDDLERRVAQARRRGMAHGRRVGPR